LLADTVNQIIYAPKINFQILPNTTIKTWMASKEITTFIVDLSPSMANKSNGRNISDLEYGLKYFDDIITNKILRGRKTDYISVITCHSNKTDNPFASDDSFKNIEVISNKVAPTYNDLRKYNELLRPNMTEIAEDEGDCFEAMLVGIGLLKDTHKLKFIRNVVVITNAETNIKTFETKVADATRNAINEMNVNVVLNGIDFDMDGLKYSQKSPEKAKNETGWVSVFETYKSGKVYSTAQIVESILHNPPLKKVKPMRTFKGQLRFGSDHFNKNENSDYDPEHDQACISLNVELYPALKAEKLPRGHQYKIDPENNSVDKTKYSKDYFIKLDSSKNEADDDDEVHKRRYVDEDENAGELESVSVNADEWTDGFKYSNYDLLTLDEDLLSSAKLASSPGMDILGFIKIADLPYAYLTGESYYLLSESSCSYKNIVGFNGLCQSLIDLEGLAIVRYVQKTNDEINVCALIPSKIRVNEKFVYAFILIRLPFKEDEKIGKFPTLTSIKTTSGKSFTTKNDSLDESAIKQESDEDLSGDTNLPNTATNELMESFILSKDLDLKEKESPQPDKFFVENNKVTLFNDSLISFPNLSNFGISSKLLVSSPAIHKFNLNIKKIITKSLEHKNLHEYLNNPNFIQDNLISNKTDSLEPSTNLFNLSNILKTNSTSNDDWLTNVNENSIDVAKRLMKELDTKYVKQEDEARKKRKMQNNNNLNDIFLMKNAQGNYGAGEGEYDELPDINDLLN